MWKWHLGLSPNCQCPVGRVAKVTFIELGIFNESNKQLSSWNMLRSVNLWNMEDVSVLIAATDLCLQNFEYLQGIKLGVSEDV